MRNSAISALGLAALVFGGAAYAQTAATTLVAGHGDPPPADAPQLAAVEIVALTGSGINAGPVFTDLTSLPCDRSADAPCDERIFVLEKRGRIWILDDGELLAEPFLDFTDLIQGSGGIGGGANAINSEQGTHGFAFHPNYAENGKFYVFHLGLFEGGSSPSRFVREYTVSANDPNRADRESERIIITLPPTGPNGTFHNGGSLVFGSDGYLYISTGDGGQGSAAVRSQDHAQNPDSLYGKILRIDVDQTSEGREYAIPPGNLYAEGEGAPEVIALGLRNPFGMVIDNDWLYVGETGELSWEEVNVFNVRTQVGTNFGWGIAEGVGCFNTGNTVPRTEDNQNCDLTGLTPPAFEYVRQGRPNPCSSIGGLVYRGEAFPELQGQYFFGDYCVGLIRSFQWEDGVARNVTNWTDMIAPGYRFGLGAITGFGADSEGEMYVLTTTYVHAQRSPNPGIARIWKIVPAEGAPEQAPRVEWTEGGAELPALAPPPWDREAPPASD